MSDREGTPTEVFSGSCHLYRGCIDPDKLRKHLETCNCQTLPDDMMSDIPPTSQSSQKKESISWPPDEETIGSTLRRLASPATRCIIAHPRGPNDSYPIDITNMETNIQPIESSDGGQITVVEQTRESPGFTLDIPFFDPPTLSSNEATIACHLNVDVYYQPNKSTLLLCNKSGRDIYIDSIPSSAREYTLQMHACCEFRIGTWKLSMALQSTEAQDEQILAYLTILPGISVATIHATMSTGVKRSADYLDNQLIPVTPFAMRLGPRKSISNDILTPAEELNDGDVMVVDTLLGAYKLVCVKVIGQRSTTKVLCCQHSGYQGFQVAKFPTTSAASLSYITRAAKNWLHERQIMRGLNHKNIQRLLEWDAEYLILIFEWLDSDLRQGDWVKYTDSEQLLLFRGVADGLVYLHERDIIHNDIKPDNVYYSKRTRTVKIINFELASMNEDHTVGGTHWYIPREALDPQKYTRGYRGKPGDIWAFGVTALYITKEMAFPRTKNNGLWIIGMIGREGKDAEDMRSWMKTLDGVTSTIEGKLIDPDTSDTRRTILAIILDMFKERSERITAQEISERLAGLPMQEQGQPRSITA